MNYQGYIIYRERVRRNWSQAGLCKGICTVSYLSKIESGRAEPSEEILRLLLARLNLETNREVEREAAGLAERGWELLLTGRRGQLRGLLRERDIERYRAVPAWLDLALLSAQTPLEPVLEPCMDVRQLAVQRILQRQEAEAVRLMPNAYTHLMLGIADYNAGSYSAAVDALQTAYDLAGREGAVRLMLEAKLFLGNAYCNRQDLPNMERHYRVGRRLAEDLQDESALRAIGYNTASAWIETGRYERGLRLVFRAGAAHPDGAAQAGHLLRKDRAARGSAARIDAGRGHGHRRDRPRACPAAAPARSVSAGAPGLSDPERVRHAAAGQLRPSPKRTAAWLCALPSALGAGMVQGNPAV